MAWTRKNLYNQSNTPEAKARRTCDGILFDSIPEMQRYRDHIKILLGCGHITDLILQPRFYLDVFDYRLGFYTADFQYKTTSGITIVEEIKGNLVNREFSIKWKLVQILYPGYKFMFLRAAARGGKYVFELVKRQAKALKTPPEKRGN